MASVLDRSLPDQSRSLPPVSDVSVNPDARLLSGGLHCRRMCHREQETLSEGLRGLTAGTALLQCRWVPSNSVTSLPRRSCLLARAPDHPEASQRGPLHRTHAPLMTSRELLRVRVWQ